MPFIDVENLTDLEKAKMEAEQKRKEVKLERALVSSSNNTIRAIQNNHKIKCRLFIGGLRLKATYHSTMQIVVVRILLESVAVWNNL